MASCHLKKSYTTIQNKEKTKAAACNSFCLLHVHPKRPLQIGDLGSLDMPPSCPGESPLYNLGLPPYTRIHLAKRSPASSDLRPLQEVG